MNATAVTLPRKGSTPAERARAARGAALLCEREHPRALRAGRIAEGVPCCPHCTLVKP